MNSRTRIGRIYEFDSTSWWGRIHLADSTSVDFHATCYIGTSSANLPRVGDEVQVTFSDDSRKRLLSVAYKRK